jgi:hypothetical protein
MRITESKLRRVIRQEIRRSHSMGEGIFESEKRTAEQERLAVEA